MPEPSRLILLEQLCTVESGSKVRFLGWHVHDIDTSQLLLTEPVCMHTTERPHNYFCETSIQQRLLMFHRHW